MSIRSWEVIDCHLVLSSGPFEENIFEVNFKTGSVEIRLDCEEGYLRGRVISIDGLVITAEITEIDCFGIGSWDVYTNDIRSILEQSMGQLQAVLFLEGGGARVLDVTDGRISEEILNQNDIARKLLSPR